MQKSFWEKEVHPLASCGNATAVECVLVLAILKFAAASGFRRPQFAVLYQH
jgi:hypothetical protein